MSQGISTYDFVQQVYYVQEKVLLDFRPGDDKYKEVLVEANLVLQELQKEEDWTWLRERIVLGRCDGPYNEIPEFELPQWVYKPSTLFDDGVRLYSRLGCVQGNHRGHRHHHQCHECHQCVNEADFIEVPWVSRGLANTSRLRHYDPKHALSGVRNDLGAVVLGDVVTFTRLLLPNERKRTAVTDVQRRISLFDVNEEDGTTIHLVEVPDPNYVIWRTAALHAEGSPPAAGRAMGIADNAQKLLSAMRENDASATAPDVLAFDGGWMASYYG